MAVSLDDDVPLILTLDEGESAPLAPSNGLGQEKLPSKSKLVGRWGGGFIPRLRAGSARQVGSSLSLRGSRVPVPHLRCGKDFAPGRLGVSPALQCPRVQCPSRSPL